MCVITWVQMLYWLMVKWIQAMVMQCSPHAALWKTEMCGNRRVLVVGLRCTILSISSCSSTVCIDLRSDDTCTLGSVPHSRNAQNTLVKTARFGVLRSGYLLRYSPQLHLHCRYSTHTRKPCPHTLRGILTNRSVTRHSQLNPTVRFTQYCVTFRSISL